MALARSISENSRDRKRNHAGADDYPPIEPAWSSAFCGSPANWFVSLGRAQRVIEEWRRDYNETRPHSSIGDMAPVAYAASLIMGSTVGRLTTGNRFP